MRRCLSALLSFIIAVSPLESAWGQTRARFVVQSASQIKIVPPVLQSHPIDLTLTASAQGLSVFHAVAAFIATPGEESSLDLVSSEVAHTPTAARLTEIVGEKSDPDEAPHAAAAAFDGAGPDPLDTLKAGERVFAPEPSRSALDAHTLADLEVMAPSHGLHALLAGKTRTAYGAHRLKTLLTHPFLDTGEIRRRQAAARELSQDPALRKDVLAALDALGKRAGETARTEFFNFISDKPFLAIGALLGSAALYIIVSASLDAVTAGSWRPILALAQGLAVWLFVAGNVVAHLRDAREKLLNYKAVGKLAISLAKPLSQSRSEALREIGKEFAQVQAKGRLGEVSRHLSRLMSSGTALVPDFLYLHSALTLWPATFGVARRRAEFARLFGALSELDVYHALAEISHAHTGWSVFPEISEAAQPSLAIEDGHHPYLATRGDSVGNDARIEPGANLHLLTGVNMGGKSTYLKMTALLALLAQIGAPVPARAMTLTPLELLTSIEIKHDLAEGKSLYDAETDRILEVIRRAEAGTRLFVIIDEILQGTNPQDRAVIERAIVRYLARTGRLFLIATHNLDVVTLEGTEANVRNVHVEESSDGRATHKVLPGPSTTRNAVETLERKGFPANIIRESRR